MHIGQAMLPIAEIAHQSNFLRGGPAGYASDLYSVWFPLGLLGFYPFLPTLLLLPDGSLCTSLYLHPLHQSAHKVSRYIGTVKLNRTDEIYSKK